MLQNLDQSTIQQNEVQSETMSELRVLGLDYTKWDQQSNADSIAEKVNRTVQSEVKVQKKVEEIGAFDMKGEDDEIKLPTHETSYCSSQPSESTEKQSKGA